MELRASIRCHVPICVLLTKMCNKFAAVAAAVAVACLRCMPPAHLLNPCTPHPPFRLRRVLPWGPNGRPDHHSRAAATAPRLCWHGGSIYQWLIHSLAPTLPRPAAKPWHVTQCTTLSQQALIGCYHWHCSWLRCGSAGAAWLLCLLLFAAQEAETQPARPQGRQHVEVNGLM